MRHSRIDLSVIAITAMYSTGHWIGATVLLGLFIVAVLRD